MVLVLRKGQIKFIQMSPMLNSDSVNVVHVWEWANENATKNLFLQSTASFRWCYCNCARLCDKLVSRLERHLYSHQTQKGSLVLQQPIFYWGTRATKCKHVRPGPKFWPLVPFMYKRKRYFDTSCYAFPAATTALYENELSDRDPS